MNCFVGDTVDGVNGFLRYMSDLCTYIIHVKREPLEAWLLEPVIESSGRSRIQMIKLQLICLVLNINVLSVIITRSRLSPRSGSSCTLSMQLIVPADDTLE